MKLHHQAQLEDANQKPWELPLRKPHHQAQPRRSTTHRSPSDSTKEDETHRKGRLKLHEPLPKVLKGGQEAPRPPHQHVVVAKATQPSMPMERRCSTGEGTLPHVLNLLNQMGFPGVDVHQLQALAEIYPP